MKIFAHRGASHDAPENTLAAFRLGWQQGADGAELDVRLSRDEKIFVCHDADTKRTTGKNRLIAATDSTALGDLPQLEQVVAEMPADRELLVEVKCGAKIAPTLAAARMQAKRVGFLSFNIGALTAVKAALPGHRCLLNLEPPRGRGRHDLDELISTCRKNDFSGVSFGWHGGLDSEAVATLHGAGLMVAVWTVDDPAIALRVRAAGADILMTNRPEEIIGALRRG